MKRVNWLEGEKMIIQKKIFSFSLISDSVISFCLLVSSLFLFSCSSPTEQYSRGDVSDPNRIMFNVPQPLDKPSNSDGGLLIYDVDHELSLEERDKKIREGSLVVIDYESGSLGSMSIRTPYKEAAKILSSPVVQPDGMTYFYPEGFIIKWQGTNEDSLPERIFLSMRHLGFVEFGLLMEEDERYIRLGQSFSKHFDPGVQDIWQDQKARNFLLGLYKYLEGKNDNCLSAGKCSFIVGQEMIKLQLPKMSFVFGRSQRRTLLGIEIYDSVVWENVGCFGSPLFDLLNFQFICGIDPDGIKRAFGLNDSYKTISQEHRNNLDFPIEDQRRHLPNDFLIQNIANSLIGWKKSRFEVGVQDITEDSPLSFIQLGSGISGHSFMFNNSLIKAEIQENNTVKIKLEPIPEDENMVYKIQEQKQAVESRQENVFYFDSFMPKIRENYTLQRHFIKALLSFLLSQYQELKRRDLGSMYLRTYQMHSDKSTASARGVLLLRLKSRPSAAIDIEIDRKNGLASVKTYLMNGDFANYIIQNQKSIDFSQELVSLSGFTLGDKIYLGDKKNEKQVFVVYKTKEDQTLRGLADYSPRGDLPVLYKGMENISVQKSERILINGIFFTINSTSYRKDIDGKVYDEYEINGIILGESFFREIDNVCFAQDFQLTMGMSHGLFRKAYIETMNRVRSKEEDFASCPYVHLPILESFRFSNSQKGYFFPDHKMSLYFIDNELYFFGIHKRPSRK